jgi:hypothetical protein
LFAADAVQAVTGIDPAASWRCAYANARAGRHLLARQGGLPAMASDIARRHGWSCVLPAMLDRGDVALVRQEDGHDALAVCLGSALVLPATRGLATVARRRAHLGWRIG